MDSEKMTEAEFARAVGAQHLNGGAPAGELGRSIITAYGRMRLLPAGGHRSMAQDDEARGDLAEESRPAKSWVRQCEVCGVRGVYIEVREIWIDGVFFGTFCGKCEMRRGTGPLPQRGGVHNLE